MCWGWLGTVAVDGFTRAPCYQVRYIASALIFKKFRVKKST